MNFNFSGQFAKSPAKGQIVSGRIVIQSSAPGRAPLFDYTFTGEFIGECADGFMVRPTDRSDWTGASTDDKGTIFCRVLH